VRSAAEARGEYLSTWEAFSPFRQQRKGDASPSRDNPLRPEWAYDAFGKGDQEFLAAWILGDCTFAVATAEAEQVAFQHGIYSPHEQMAGAASPASDMFAFGATLYYAMAGHEPPPVPVDQATVSPAPPDSHGGYFISRHVTKLMASSPHDRPRADEQVREGSLISAYCGKLDLGNETYLVMNTFESETALSHGPSIDQ
jgi:hypothetical protein